MFSPSSVYPPHLYILHIPAPTALLGQPVGNLNDLAPLAKLPQVGLLAHVYYLSNMIPYRRMVHDPPLSDMLVLDGAD